MENLDEFSVLLDSQNTGSNVYNTTTTTKLSKGDNNNNNGTKALKNKNKSRKFLIFAMVGLSMIVISGIALYFMGGNLEKFLESNGGTSNGNDYKVSIEAAKNDKILNDNYNYNGKMEASKDAKTLGGSIFIQENVEAAKDDKILDDRFSNSDKVEAAKDAKTLNGNIVQIETNVEEAKDSKTLNDNGDKVEANIEAEKNAETLKSA